MRMAKPISSRSPCSGKNNAITTAKSRAGAVQATDIGAGAVGSAALADDSVTTGKLVAGAVAGVGAGCAASAQNDGLSPAAGYARLRAGRARPPGVRGTSGAGAVPRWTGPSVPRWTGPSSTGRRCDQTKNAIAPTNRTRAT
jgi:hypothetical protein